MFRLEKLVSVERLINEAKRYKYEELDLSYCALQVIPEEVFQLKQIKILKLIGNKLTAVPRQLGELLNLTHLYLYKNNISDIPDDVIDSIKYLECLDLAENPIYYKKDRFKAILKRMDSWKGYKESLRQIELSRYNQADRLYLSYNVKSFPPEIYQLTNLEYLDFHGKNVSELPEGISKLKKLRELDLTGNKLERLPSDIVGMENLEKLVLIDNEFHDFPNEILQLPKLKIFNISKNHLKDFNKEILSKATMKEFYAFENPFLNFSPNVFNYPFNEIGNHI